MCGTKGVTTSSSSAGQHQHMQHGELMLCNQPEDFAAF
jgi:hypothetical protein